MSLPVFLACLWVIAAAIVAFLPIRIQKIVGWPLLVAALVLIGWLGARHGFWLAAIGLFGLVSMFRKPLMYYWRMATGKLEDDV